MTIKAEYCDHMGTDLTVVNAARVSMAKHSFKLDDKDENLIWHLSEGGHWTPFGHCVIQMRETIPIFTARQRFKHTVGFVYNEESRRYIDSDPDVHYPERWRMRPEKSIKQGSGADFNDTMNDHLKGEYADAMEYAIKKYRYFLDQGAAPEQARMLLPQAMITSYYVTGSLAAWVRAYHLRIDGHAQKEIQWLAEDWAKVIEPLFPHAWKALTTERPVEISQEGIDFLASNKPCGEIELSTTTPVMRNG